MAVIKKHIIRKLFVDVVYHSSADGLQLQKEVTDWCRNQLLPQLEAMLEGMWEEEEPVRISTLEIDITMDGIQEWKEPALKKLELQLHDKRQFQVKAADAMVTKTLVRGFEEEFVFFLLKGYLPWSTTIESQDRFLELLHDWMANDNRNSGMIAMAFQLENARQRLVYLLPDALFFKLLTTVYEDQSAIISLVTYTQDFLKELPYSELVELRYDIKQLLLLTLTAHAPPLRETFVNALLELLNSRHWIITYRANIYPKSQALHNAVTNLLITTEMQTHWMVTHQLHEEESATETPGHDAGKNASAAPPVATASPLLSNEPEAAVSLAGSGEQKESGITSLQKEAEKNEKERNAEPGSQPSFAKERDKIRTPENISGKPPADLLDQTAAPAVEKNDSPVKERAMEKSVEKPARTGEGDDKPVAERDAGTAFSAERKHAEARAPEVDAGRKNEIRNHLLQEISGTTEDEGSIYIGNSGLMIVAPFLPVFFKRVGLLENDSIKDHAKAILLLHYLATGCTSAAEYEVVLPKILCGLEPEHPVNLQLEWQEGWSLECRDLLLSVIEYWAVLKDTSPEGLREAFLQRNGKLSKSEKGWLLQVEQRPYDMLLQQLPWNLTMIKLGWMKTMIRTEWT